MAKSQPLPVHRPLPFPLLSLLFIFCFVGRLWSPMAVVEAKSLTVSVDQCWTDGGTWMAYPTPQPFDFARAFCEANGGYLPAAFLNYTTTGGQLRPWSAYRRTFAVTPPAWYSVSQRSIDPTSAFQLQSMSTGAVDEECTFFDTPNGNSIVLTTRSCQSTADVVCQRPDPKTVPRWFQYRYPSTPAVVPKFLYGMIPAAMSLLEATAACASQEATLAVLPEMTTLRVAWEDAVFAALRSSSASQWKSRSSQNFNNSYSYRFCSDFRTLPIKNGFRTAYDNTLLQYSVIVPTLESYTPDQCTGTGASSIFMFSEDELTITCQLSDDPVPTLCMRQLISMSHFFLVGSVGFYASWYKSVSSNGGSPRTMIAVQIKLPTMAISIQSPLTFSVASTNASVALPLVPTVTFVPGGPTVLEVDFVLVSPGYFDAIIRGLDPYRTISTPSTSFGGVTVLNDIMTLSMNGSLMPFYPGTSQRVTFDILVDVASRPQVPLTVVTDTHWNDPCISIGRGRIEIGENRGSILVTRSADPSCAVRAPNPIVEFTVVPSLGVVWRNGDNTLNISFIEPPTIVPTVSPGFMMELNGSSLSICFDASPYVDFMTSGATVAISVQRSFTPECVPFVLWDPPQLLRGTTGGGVACFVIRSHPTDRVQGDMTCNVSFSFNDTRYLQPASANVTTFRIRQRLSFVMNFPQVGTSSTNNTFEMTMTDFIGTDPILVNLGGSVTVKQQGVANSICTFLSTSRNCYGTLESLVPSPLPVIFYYSSSMTAAALGTVMPWPLQRADHIQYSSVMGGGFTRALRLQPDTFRSEAYVGVPYPCTYSVTTDFYKSHVVTGIDTMRLQYYVNDPSSVVCSITECTNSGKGHVDLPRLLWKIGPLVASTYVNFIAGDGSLNTNISGAEALETLGVAFGFTLRVPLLKSGSDKVRKFVPRLFSSLAPTPVCFALNGTLVNGTVTVAVSSPTCLSFNVPNVSWAFLPAAERYWTPGNEYPTQCVLATITTPCTGTIEVKQYSTDVAYSDNFAFPASIVGTSPTFSLDSFSFYCPGIGDTLPLVGSTGARLVGCQWTIRVNFALKTTRPWDNVTLMLVVSNVCQGEAATVRQVLRLTALSLGAAVLRTVLLDNFTFCGTNITAKLVVLDASTRVDLDPATSTLVLPMAYAPVMTVTAAWKLNNDGVRVAPVVPNQGLGGVGSQLAVWPHQMNKLMIGFVGGRLPDGHILYMNVSDGPLSCIRVSSNVWCQWANRSTSLWSDPTAGRFHVGGVQSVRLTYAFLPVSLPTSTLVGASNSSDWTTEVTMAAVPLLTPSVISPVREFMEPTSSSNVSSPVPAPPIAVRLPYLPPVQEGFRNPITVNLTGSSLQTAPPDAQQLQGNTTCIFSSLPVNISGGETSCYLGVQTLLSGVPSIATPQSNITVVLTDVGIPQSLVLPMAFATTPVWVRPRALVAWESVNLSATPLYFNATLMLKLVVAPALIDGGSVRTTPLSLKVVNPVFQQSGAVFDASVSPAMVQLEFEVCQPPLDVAFRSSSIGLNNITVFFDSVSGATTLASRYQLPMPLTLNVLPIVVAFRCESNLFLGPTDAVWCNLTVIEGAFTHLNDVIVSGYSIVSSSSMVSSVGAVLGQPGFTTTTFSMRGTADYFPTTVTSIVISQPRGVVVQPPPLSQFVYFFALPSPRYNVSILRVARPSICRFNISITRLPKLGRNLSLTIETIPSISLNATIVKWIDDPTSRLWQIVECVGALPTRRQRLTLVVSYGMQSSAIEFSGQGNMTLRSVMVPAWTWTKTPSASASPRSVSATLHSRSTTVYSKSVTPRISLTRTPLWTSSRSLPRTPTLVFPDPIPQLSTGAQASVTTAAVSSALSGGSISGAAVSRSMASISQAQRCLSADSIGELPFPQSAIPPWCIGEDIPGTSTNIRCFKGATASGALLMGTMFVLALLLSGLLYWYMNHIHRERLSWYHDVCLRAPWLITVNVVGILTDGTVSGGTLVLSNDLNGGLAYFFLGLIVPLLLFLLSLIVISTRTARWYPNWLIQEVQPEARIFFKKERKTVLGCMFEIIVGLGAWNVQPEHAEDGAGGAKGSEELRNRFFSADETFDPAWLRERVKFLLGTPFYGKYQERLRTEEREASEGDTPMSQKLPPSTLLDSLRPMYFSVDLLVTILISVCSGVTTPSRCTSPTVVAAVLSTLLFVFLVWIRPLPALGRMLFAGFVSLLAAVNAWILVAGATTNSPALITVSLYFAVTLMNLNFVGVLLMGLAALLKWFINRRVRKHMEQYEASLGMPYATGNLLAALLTPETLASLDRDEELNAMVVDWREEQQELRALEQRQGVHVEVEYLGDGFEQTDPNQSAAVEVLVSPPLPPPTAAAEPPAAKKSETPAHVPSMLVNDDLLGEENMAAEGRRKVHPSGPTRLAPHEHGPSGPRRLRGEAKMRVDGESGEVMERPLQPLTPLQPRKEGDDDEDDNEEGDDGGVEGIGGTMRPHDSFMKGLLL